MTKDRLQSLPINALCNVAMQQGIVNCQDMQRDDLIEAIIEAFDEAGLERSEDDNWTIKSEEKKFAIFRDEELDIGETESCPIPDKYNLTKIVLVMVNPLMAFVYWEIGDESKAAVLASAKLNSLMLRVHEINNTTGDKGFFDIQVQAEDDKWYINLPSHGCIYYIELICKSSFGEDNVLCTSNKIESPLKISRDIVKDENMYRDDFLVLAGVYGFYDDDDADSDNSQKIVSFLNNGSIREGV